MCWSGFAFLNGMRLFLPCTRVFFYRALTPKPHVPYSGNPRETECCPPPTFLQVVHSALMKKSLMASRSDRAGAGGRALAWGPRTCLLTLY